MGEEIWTGQEQVLSFGEDELPWTLANSYCHSTCTGRSGAGKTSGPIAALAKGLLAQDVGMLFLCVKADAAEDIEKWAKAVGRENDLVFFGRDESYRFNPLAFESAHGQGGQTMSLVEFLDNMISIASPQDSGGEAFWRNARGELLKSAIDVIRFSSREVSLEGVQKLVSSAPQTVDEMSKPHWKSGFCAAVLAEAKVNASGTENEADWLMCERYFTATFPNMSDKTRGTVVSDLTSMLDNLLRGLPGRLFSADTNIDPSALEEGKIIVIDFPVLKYGVAGRLINAGWKYCVQKYFQAIAPRRRDNPSARPVMILVDEAQYVMLPASDVMALTTLRSTKLGVHMATQNISNFFVALGKGSEHEVNSVLGNVGTFFLGSNLSAATHKWISEMVGDKRETLTTTGRTNSYKNPLDFVPGVSDSHSLSETFRPHLIQEDFITLKSGGPQHDFIVESIVVEAGRKWKNGALFKKVAFDQRA